MEKNVCVLCGLYTEEWEKSLHRQCDLEEYAKSEREFYIQIQTDVLNLPPPQGEADYDNIPT